MSGRRPLIEEEPEGPSGSASCFDHVDNDCDNLVDHADPECTSVELCNGSDDDNDLAVDEDFPDLGQPCTVGIGTCQRSGVRICSGNGLTTTCSALPGPAGSESPPGGGSCSDGDDNDCDALVDLADPDCREDEKCDGLDNDGDGDVDEDFDLGAACSDGIGICMVNGQKICRPDGSGTACDVKALAPEPEGPAGTTCADSLDNDCDALVDNADANCGSSGLAATCALTIIWDSWATSRWCHERRPCGPPTELDVRATFPTKGTKATRAFVPFLLDAHAHLTTADHQRGKP